MEYKAVQQATLLADRQLSVLKEVARKKAGSMAGSVAKRELDFQYERGFDDALEKAIRIIEAQEGMAGWKRRILMCLREEYGRSRGEHPPFDDQWNAAVEALRAHDYAVSHQYAMNAGKEKGDPNWVGAGYMAAADWRAARRPAPSDPVRDELVAALESFLRDNDPYGNFQPMLHKALAAFKAKYYNV